MTRAGRIDVRAHTHTLISPYPMMSLAIQSCIYSRHLLLGCRERFLHRPILAAVRSCEEQSASRDHALRVSLLKRAVLELTGTEWQCDYCRVSANKIVSQAVIVALYADESPSQL